MELKQYFNVLLKWWWLIAISVIVAGGASYLGARATPKSYQSRTTLMVGQPPGAGNAYDAQQLALFLSDMARREPVLRSALDALDLKWDWGVLQASVTSRVVPGTQMLEIAVLDTDPERAQVLTEEIAHQVVLLSANAENPDLIREQQYVQTQIKDLRANIDKAQAEIQSLDNTIAQATTVRQIQEARTRQDSLRSQVSSWQATYAQLVSSLQNSATSVLTTIEPARFGAQVGTGVSTSVLMAAAIGLILSAGAAFLLEYLDDSIKSTDDVSRTLGLPTVGRVTNISGDTYADKLITIHQPRSPTSEAYRILRTNLQFSNIDRTLQAVMVTSSNPQEGKSLTAANLAVVMAQSGARVLLIDADLRRPAQHEIFELDNNVGLTLLLSKNPLSVPAVLQNSPVDYLKIITSGPIPPNPSELLGSKRMSSLMESMRGEFELIVIDSPPILAVSDASILSTRVDASLLVIDAGHTRRDAAEHAKTALSAVGTSLAGVVLNRLPQRSSGYTYYYADGRRREKRRWRSGARDTLQALFGSRGRFRRKPKEKRPEVATSERQG